MLALLALWMSPPDLGPAPASNLSLAAPIKTWDEGIPLGNGQLGALLWGEGSILNVSLDRGDIWDNRVQGITDSPAWTYQHMLQLVQDKNQDQLVHLFDEPYDQPTPTKLPGIRLEIQLKDGAEPTAFKLNLKSGEGSVEGKAGSAQFSIPEGNPVLVAHLAAPIEKVSLHASTAVAALGFPPAHYGREAAGSWVLQTADGGLEYAAYVSIRPVKDGEELAVSFATNAHNGLALREARRLAVEALRPGYAAQQRRTAQGWNHFWEASQVRVPDQKVQAAYDFAMYLYGAGSRRGSPPLPLQGLWTADDGKLPPWKGDYHHDLNTEMTYWPFLASGHWEQGEALTDFLWSQLHTYEEFARDFYQKPGAAIPGVAALDGSPLGGWPMYSLSPTMGLWISMAFIDTWRYTGDGAFLRKRAYPFCRDLAVCTVGLLHPTPDGILRLPASSSPEIHDEDLSAWLKPNSNFDLSVLKAFFQGMAEMAEALHQDSDAALWKSTVNKLGNFYISPKDGSLRVDANQDLEESHRHFSNFMAIHPFSLISVEGSDEDRKVIDASLAHIAKLGTQAWCGYSFAWMACLNARCGRFADAAKNLDIFANAFCLRNGFHANGDQSGKGYSGFTYRPVTLEGNFGAAEAVQEMLLQSWGGKVRLFPAAWPDASFDKLRTAEGFIVSAVRRAGKTQSATITATRTGALHLRADSALHWQTPSGQLSGASLDIDLKAGQTVTGS